MSRPLRIYMSGCVELRRGNGAFGRAGALMMAGLLFD